MLIGQLRNISFLIKNADITVIETYILATIEEHIKQFFKENIPKKYVYHDITHTQDVVRVSRQIGLTYGLPMEDLELLQIAAWFHDTGYTDGPEGHEERSIINAHAFLQMVVHFAPAWD